MCTLTWARTPAGYELFFNRDELKTRRRALPPGVHETAGVRWLAAIDADAGGTWLGVNERGVCIGLLNGWRNRDQARPDATSRGLLVTSLLDVASTDEVEGRLLGRDLTEFRSFGLIALESGGQVLRGTWDGEQLACERLGDDRQPISSSSRDPEGAERNRRAVWSRLTDGGRLPGPEELMSFHGSHEPEPGAWSPCMHRDDAETVSFTRIAVDSHGVALDYRPGATCGGAPFVELRLPRSPVPAVG